MRSYQEIKTYNLLNANGDRLQLVLGITDNPYEEYPICTADNGFRWKFIGRKIPMPVRSDYWFNGFSEDTMLLWLKEHGWYLRTCVHKASGWVDVYELPKADEPNKADKAYELSALAIEQGEDSLEEAVIRLCNANLKLKAVALYRYVHPCTLQEAKYAVDKIQNMA